ncbi:MAG: chemotaxis protein [Lysobacter sp.]|nr:chemotaxis protein [Lysobacter sp.]
MPASATTQRATEAPVAPQFNKNLDAIEQKISSLSLVGSANADATHGAVAILAGIGGPDAVRQILTALPAGFPRAVLISQRLDGGRYDRLVQQMARAATLPVRLAEVGAQVEAGNVYIVPPELGIDGHNGLRFAPGFSLLDALPAKDSAVLLLSGADPAVVDAALAHAEKGALVAGQSPDGCYDAAAPMALTARGGTAGAPNELVQSLLQRWPA